MIVKDVIQDGKGFEIWQHGKNTVYVVKHNNYARIYPTLDDLFQIEYTPQIAIEVSYITTSLNSLSELYKSANYNFEDLKETCQSDKPMVNDVVYCQEEDAIFVVSGNFQEDETIITETGDILRYGSLKKVLDAKTLQEYLDLHNHLEISRRAIELITEFKTNLKNVPKRKSTLRVG